VVCGTLVYADDARGRVGSQIAHAECALVHWLTFLPPEPRRPSAGTAQPGPEPADSQRHAVLDILLRP
jgi:hypothetical protein